MTADGRGRDVVEGFLADLAETPVPAGLASSVAAHVRTASAGERRSHASNRWLPLVAALALAVVALVGFAVATNPSPAPIPSLEPSPTTVPTRSPEASFSAEPSRTPAASPIASPTASSTSS